MIIVCNEKCSEKAVLATNPATIPAPISYASTLETEINGLRRQLQTKDEDLDCKIEIISMLEGLIFTKCSQEIQEEAAIKMSEIMKKHI